MKGVNYIVDDHGKKTDVVINLIEHGELWEDFNDLIVSKSRENEERVSWQKIKTGMEK